MLNWFFFIKCLPVCGMDSGAETIKMFLLSLFKSVFIFFNSLSVFRDSVLFVCKYNLVIFFQ